MRNALKYNAMGGIEAQVLQVDCFFDCFFGVSGSPNIKISLTKRRTPLEMLSSQTPHQIVLDLGIDIQSFTDRLREYVCELLS